MSKNKKNNVLITDEGTIVNKKDFHSMIFVIVCRVLTGTLAVLGIAALILGNL